jgi:hypothetical protein
VSADLSCGDASTLILPANTGTSKPTQSLVLMIEYEEVSVIFSGDAQGVTGAQAIEDFDGNVKASVVAASHHGANTDRSNRPKWIAATSPEIVVYSAGTRFNHPRCIALERFTSVTETREHDMRCGDPGGFRPVFRTKEAHYATAISGAIIVTSNGTSPVTMNCTRSAECGVKIAH